METEKPIEPVTISELNAGIEDLRRKADELAKTKSVKERSEELEEIHAALDIIKAMFDQVTKKEDLGVVSDQITGVAASVGHVYESVKSITDMPMSKLIKFLLTLNILLSILIIIFMVIR